MEKVNGVILTTISTLKQQVSGNSPEDQVLQCRLFAENRNINIVQVFAYTISRANEDETIVKAIIEYCKNSDVRIKYLIFKCIDRFSRGGSYFYTHLKRELAKYGIDCLDVYGVIQQPINTLAHLGVEFKWSMVSPTENAELLEANRAKQEVSTILTRMIGAEIGYRRQGYAVRSPKLGLKHKKITTPEGIRVVYEAHPEESKWIVKMFELRAEGILPDEEIVKQVNELGFVSKDRVRWDKTKPKPVPLGMIKGKELDVKQMQKMLQYTEYAGILCDKWTYGYKAIRSAYFKGIVSIGLFNKANRGKVAIIENEDGSVEIAKNIRTFIRNKDNPLFPYKEAILCPICKSELRGSSPRSKSGKHIARYHCDKNHKYWSLNRDKFHTQVYDFIRAIKFKKDFIRLFSEVVIDVWNKKEQEAGQLAIDYGKVVQGLRERKQAIKEKLIMVSSKEAVSMLEEELQDVEAKIAVNTQVRDNSEDEEQNIDMLITYAKYFMEHLEDLLIVEGKPEQQKLLFQLLFEERPTYDELINGTPKLACIYDLNTTSSYSKEDLVNPRRNNTFFKV
jgi:site-specific DNA recombinase